MITQHICGRSSNNLGEKKCFQFICPTEINVDTLRNLSILVDTLRLQSVDDVKRCHTQVSVVPRLIPSMLLRLFSSIRGISRGIGATAPIDVIIKNNKVNAMSF